MKKYNDFLSEEVVSTKSEVAPVAQPATPVKSAPVKSPPVKPAVKITTKKVPTTAGITTTTGTTTATTTDATTADTAGPVINNLEKVFQHIISFFNNNSITTTRK